MYHIKNDKRAKQSSKLIFNALKILIKEKNYDSITITQITDTAKIGRATFYRNFDSKDDVLLYEIDKKCKMFVSFIQKFVEDGKLTKSLFRLSVEFWDMHSELIELLMTAQKSYLIYTPLLNVIKEFKETYSDHKTEETLINFIAELRTHVMLVVLCKWIESGKYLSENQLVRLAADQIKRAAQANILE